VKKPVCLVMAANLREIEGSDAKPTESSYTSAVQLPVPYREVAVLISSTAVELGA
jgi:hypothetical protein